MIRLSLPYPPSVNHLYGDSHYLKPEVRDYRREVGNICLAERVNGLGLAHDLDVAIMLHPKDKRARDVDNYPKAILDALTHAGVWQDDKLISKLTIERMAPSPGNPRAVVCIVRRCSQGELL